MHIHTHTYDAQTYTGVARIFPIDLIRPNRETFERSNFRTNESRKRKGEGKLSPIIILGRGITVFLSFFPSYERSFSFSLLFQRRARRILFLSLFLPSFSLFPPPGTVISMRLRSAGPDSRSPHVVEKLKSRCR